MGRDKCVFNTSEHDDKVFTMMSRELYRNMYSTENKVWSSAIGQQKINVSVNKPIRGKFLQEVQL